MNQDDKSILVCPKIEYMRLQPFSRAECMDCKAIVGYTKASHEAFKNAKNKHYLCTDCFENFLEKTQD
jgi:hypothetical protein